MFAFETPCVEFKCFEYTSKNAVRLNRPTQHKFHSYLHELNLECYLQPKKTITNISQNKTIRMYTDKKLNR